jgi:hypothetical protein
MNTDSWFWGLLRCWEIYYAHRAKSPKPRISMFMSAKSDGIFIYHCALLVCQMQFLTVQAVSRACAVCTRAGGILSYHCAVWVCETVRVCPERVLFVLQEVVYLVTTVLFGCARHSPCVLGAPLCPECLQC